jgi:hypothetical protein
MTNQTLVTTSNVQGRAILVSLKISQWLARKFDGVATAHVNAAAGAEDAGKFSKKLIAKRDSDGERNPYGLLVQCLAEARQDHYLNSLAWGNEGWRLLPVKNYDVYARRQRTHERAFNKALNAFVRVYPALRDEAPRALGTLFRAADYPLAEEIRAKFSIDYLRDPLPIKGERMVDEFAAPQVQRVRDEYNAKIEQRVADATDAAMTDARERIGKVVREFAETMNKKKGEPGHGFKDTKITGLRELVSTMRRLNIAEDGEFTSMLDRVDATLADVDPQVLRDDTGKRAAIAKTADEIVADMTDAFGSAT